jgi:hypothetical protein
MKSRKQLSDNDNNIIIVLIMLLIVFVIFNYLFTKENEVGNNQSPTIREGFEGGAEENQTPSVPDFGSTPNSGPNSNSGASANNLDCDCGPPVDPSVRINKKMVSCRGTELEICHNSLTHCSDTIRGDASDQIYYILYPDVYGSADIHRKNYIGIRKDGDIYRIHLSDQKMDSLSYKWNIVPVNETNPTGKYLAKSMTESKEQGEEIIMCDDGTFFSLKKYTSGQQPNVDVSNCAWNLSQEHMSPRYRHSNSPMSHRFAGLTLESETLMQESNVLGQNNKILALLQANGLNLSGTEIGTSRDLAQAGSEDSNKPIDIFIKSNDTTQDTELLLGLGQSQFSKSLGDLGGVFGSAGSAGLSENNNLDTSELASVEDAASAAASAATAATSVATTVTEAAVAAAAAAGTEGAVAEGAAAAEGAATTVTEVASAAGAAAAEGGAVAEVVEVASAANIGGEMNLTQLAMRLQNNINANGGFRNIISESFANNELSANDINAAESQTDGDVSFNTLLDFAKKLNKCSKGNLVSINDFSCESCDTSQFD